MQYAAGFGDSLHDDLPAASAETRVGAAHVDKHSVFGKHSTRIPRKDHREERSLTDVLAITTLHRNLSREGGGRSIGGGAMDALRSEWANEWMDGLMGG